MALIQVFLSCIVQKGSILVRDILIDKYLPVMSPTVDTLELGVTLKTPVWGSTEVKDNVFILKICLWGHKQWYNCNISNS